MTPNEYLDAAKNALGIEADNALATKFEMNSGTITEIRQAKRGVSVELAFRLAITLKLDPAGVIADLESQRATREKKRNFWTGFLSRAVIAVALACTLALNFSATCGSEAARLGGKKRRVCCA